MDSFISAQPSPQPFITFSSVHLATLATLICINLLLIALLRKYGNDRLNSCFRRTLAILLLASELAYVGWYMLSGLWTAQDHLPVHLCDASLFLSAYLLLKKNRLAYEIAYFTGLGGSVQALLTPGLTAYSFPHIIYFIFFITHGGVVTALLYMTLMEGFRPQPLSILKAFGFINIYMVFIFIVNSVVKGNYMFLSGKPSTPSILDYLGPWPLYILELELVGMLLFIVLYSPFFVTKYMSRRNDGPGFKVIEK